MRDFMVGKYNLLKCRHITDKTDLLLAELWGVEEAYDAAGNLRDRMVFGEQGVAPLPKILDNIDLETERELLETLGSSYRLDAAIGYFNLRGWRLLAEAVDALPKRSEGPKARILVGIHEAPAEEMRRLARMRQPEPTDNRTAGPIEG